MGRAEVLPILRLAVAFIGMLFVMVTSSPFADLSTEKALEITSGSEAVTYLLIIGLVGCGVLLLPKGAMRALASLLHPINLLIIAWLGFSVLISPDKMTSLRRLILSLAVLALAALIPILITNLRSFARLFLVVAAIIIILSFAGVILAPHYAIHQSWDAIEPHLAGGWRGIYAHKNLTAAIMACFMLFGIFIARSGMMISGIVIFVAAMAFLLATQGKSAGGLVFVALLLAFVIARVRSLPVKMLVALGPLLLINFLSVGSVTSEISRSILKALPIDATFTGRTDIWEFAIASIADKPMTGYGYQAFWNSEIVKSQISKSANAENDWAVLAATSHNSYVDLALTIGLPGLALIILGFLVWPLIDYHRSNREGANGVLATFALTIWLFSIYLGSFEAIFLTRADPSWFLLACSVCMLRYARLFKISV